MKNDKTRNGNTGLKYRAGRRGVIVEPVMGEPQPDSDVRTASSQLALIVGLLTFYLWLG